MRTLPLFLCFLIAPIAGCGTTYEPEPGGAGPGGRRQPLSMAPGQELATGRQAYAEVMNEYRNKGVVLPKDSPQARRTRAVVERLARATEIPILQREIMLRMRGYRFEWEVNVVRDKQVNAFCLPAGKMVVFTGILTATGGDDDFLATVLSHEMAHALAHHASERVAVARTQKNILRSMAYSRMQEEEADHIGVFLMAFAGYDARKAPLFWQRMRQMRGKGGGRLEIFSDHPSDGSRIRELAEQAPRAMAAKRQYDLKWSSKEKQR